LFAAPDIFSELRLAIGQIQLVPTQNNTSSSVYRADIAITRFWNFTYELTGAPHVVRIAQIVLQRLQRIHERLNRVLIIEATSA
jgi:hypothetical protein